MSRRVDAAKIDFREGESADGGRENWEHVGATASHYGVDCEESSRDESAAGRQDCDDCIRINLTGQLFEEGFDPGLPSRVCRRDPSMPRNHLREFQCPARPAPIRRIRGSHPEGRKHRLHIRFRPNRPCNLLGRLRICAYARRRAFTSTRPPNILLLCVLSLGTAPKKRGETPQSSVRNAFVWVSVGNSSGASGTLSSSQVGPYLSEIGLRASRSKS